MKFSRVALAVCSGAIICCASNTAFAAAEADLLVAYDQTHSASVGGQDNANVLAANAVAGCNAVHERSGTGARVRIVGYYQAAQYLYQTTSKGGFVNWMANYDSHMTDVVDMGNARGADLVTWICVSTSDGAAAVAQQPGRYSAFDPGQFWTAVVAHELGGHNFGCDHRGGRLSPKTVMMHNYCEGGGATPPYIFSNPNIWLNGVKLLGEGSCLGAAVDGGDNAYLVSVNCQGVADRYARVVTAPSLGNVVRRWAFNQSAASAPTGTTVTDSVTGTELATVQGSGATFTGSGLRTPGGASGSGAAYLQLPSGVISAYTDVTIEIWAKPISAPSWSRVMDFNNGTANYIMLTACNGTDLNAQRFDAMNGGSSVSLDSAIPTVAGVLHHYAITYTSAGGSSGRWTWYRDGDEVAYLDVSYPLSSLQDVNNWLGRSAYGTDALANCEYQEVRISNIAMSRDQVAANAKSLVPIGKVLTPI
ncbi:MAG: LamG domain-containing protein [Verrucomicrobiota bacterium]